MILITYSTVIYWMPTLCQGPSWSWSCSLETLPKRWSYSKRRRQKLSTNNNKKELCVLFLTDVSDGAKYSESQSRVREERESGPGIPIYTGWSGHWLWAFEDHLSEEREWPCQCLLEEWGVGYMFHFTQIYFWEIVCKLSFSLRIYRNFL